MGDLTANFSRSEFMCKCNKCFNSNIDVELVDELQECRDDLNQKYKNVKCEVKSGIRCFAHNEATQRKNVPGYVAGSSKSQHMPDEDGVGHGADVQYTYETEDGEREIINPIEVHTWFDGRHSHSYGLGLYTNRNHIDNRRYRARWDKR